LNEEKTDTLSKNTVTSKSKDRYSSPQKKKIMNLKLRILGIPTDHMARTHHANVTLFMITKNKESD